MVSFRASRLSRFSMVTSMKISQLPVCRFLSILIILTTLLAGCTPATPAPAPTLDPATLVAAAVQTLSAQQTQQALLNPTATYTLQPTATTAPTNTPEPPTATPTLSFTLTPVPPTNTPAPAVSALFQYTTTYPENKREYVPNEKFGLAVGFKNTGTVTWDSNYTLKIVSFVGEITVQQDAMLGKSVKPGEKGEFNLWAYGSETITTHTWVFQMYTSSGGAVPGGSAVFSYKSH